MADTTTIAAGFQRTLRQRHADAIANISADKASQRYAIAVARAWQAFDEVWGKAPADAAPLGNGDTQAPSLQIVRHPYPLV